MNLIGLKSELMPLSWMRTMTPVSKIVVGDEQDLVKVSFASIYYGTSTEMM